jgi:spore germination protein
MNNFLLPMGILLSKGIPLKGWFYMKNRVVIPVLILTLVVVAGWGYTQYQARHKWEISTENQYKRAFEELNGHVNNLETLESKALVAGSFPQLVSLLTDCWREANACQENLGQLPLTSMELSKTKTLLASVGTFCFNSAQNRLLKGTQANETEWDKLKSFRDQTRIVARSLLNLRQQFHGTPASWLDVERVGTLGASATGLATSLNNNKVTKAFLMLEDGLRRTPDIQFEGNNLGFVPKPTGLTGSNVSTKEAEGIARKFLGSGYQGATIKNDRIIKGGFPSYMISATVPGNPAKDRRLSISVKGGHVVWILGNRYVPNAKLNFDRCEASALNFLNKNGFSNMKRVACEAFSNIATLTFVPDRNQILRYPELVKCQVAQDNGEILGYEAMPYLTFNNPREPQKQTPRYSENRIRQILNPHLKPEKIQLSQVLDQMYNKVLCYEVTGTQGANLFKIYYNAATGKEEKIRRVDKNGNEVI